MPTALRHDMTVFINNTTSWYGCLYQQHYVILGCLYQQHFVMIGRLCQQHYVTTRLFISTTLRHDRPFMPTALRHDMAVYINNTTSWYGCLYQQHYVIISCLYQQHYVMIGRLCQQHYATTRLFISTTLRHDTAVYVNSTTSRYGCLYQQHYVTIRLFILCNVNTKI